jgi:nanoRNase/pAp phosphatase (c-di-AMP/oligoRNAs hydrolase)
LHEQPEGVATFGWDPSPKRNAEDQRPMARRSAAAERAVPAEAEPPSERRSDRFLAGLENASRVTFVSHVHPDPDGLGSMMGLAHLVESTLGTPTRMTRDGPISRAENRAMVELLDLELLPVDDLTWDADEAVVMVDSQPNTGRHTLERDCPLYAVLDHHATGGDLRDVPFVDVRRHLGATCTLVTRYLIEQQIPLPANVATGLMYGIETELGGYPREASPLDDGALQFLYPLADKDLIARIRNARLPHCYFECMLTALQSSFIYDRLVISWVNELPQPELAAEVCDFLIRFEEIDWAVCAGVYKDKLILSARTSQPEAQAGEVLRQVVGKLGRAGGHDRRAGGMIKLASTAPSAIEEVQGELRRRLLKALRIDETRGQRLVPLREMLQNLQS